MVTVEQVSSILRALSPTKIEIPGDSTVSFVVSGISVALPVAEFDLYLRMKSTMLQGTETSLFSPGYFEQAIEVQGRGPASYRLFRTSDKISLPHEPTGLLTEVGPVTPQFVMHLSDSEAMHKDFRRLVLNRTPILRGRDTVGFDDLFARILSVRVTAPPTHSLHSNQKQLRAISDAALFNVAYGYGTGLVPIRSWERSLHMLEARRREEVQFPLRSYNHELVAYYQMALGAESLILSYLALYKILEYFFTAASEHLLHAKLVEQLVAPDFSHTKLAKLRELAKVVRRFDQRMDERRMLQTVFEQHIGRDSLRAWIEDFDKENSNHFTSEREIFGEPSKVDVSDSQLFPTIGARIYHIRNALVHNKEGEVSRFIPFSGQEKVLVNEVPLLRRLAEELIVKTGKDLPLG